MVDRYAKFATEHLATAAKRIETVTADNVIELSRFCHGPGEQGLTITVKPLEKLVV